MTGKKITGRTKQLSLKSTPEFHQKLKEIAAKEKCLMIEILEQAIAVWEVQKQKELVKKMMKETMPKPRDIAMPSVAKKRQLEIPNEETETSSKKVRISK